MSVSALIKNQNCCVFFHPSYCVFQDLRTGQRIGGGGETDGLYTLDMKRTESKALQSEAADENKVLLWNHRLGHAPVQCLKNFSFIHIQNKSVGVLRCDHVMHVCWPKKNNCAFNKS